MRLGTGKSAREFFVFHFSVHQSLTALSLALLIPAVAIAQDQSAEDDNDLLQLGALTVSPSITVSEQYYDNIFATRNNKVDDFITIISPSLELNSSDENYKFRAFGDADIGRYQQNEGENYDDWRLGGEGRYYYADGGSVFGGINYSYDHEERVSPDDVNGTEPTTYNRLGSFGGINQEFGSFTTRIGGTFEQFDYDDVPAGAGLTIDNDDRDRDMYTFGGRIGYKLNSKLEPFVQVAADIRDYDQTFDNAGLRRSSDGYNSAAGLVYRPAANLRAEVLVGWLEQNYDDTALKDVSTYDYGAQLTWLPSARTRLKASIDRTVEETTILTASSYVRSAIGADLTHYIRPDLFFSAYANYSDNDYYGPGRNDNLLAAGMGLRYYLTRKFFVGMDYSFLQRDSNVPVADFDNNSIFLRLGAQLAPAYNDEDMLNVASDNNLLNGFYIGAQGGINEIGTALSGPRGPTAGGGGPFIGSLLHDFRDNGAVYGLFGGYALNLDKWRLALELEADQSNAQWDHARRPGGRVFSVEKDTDLGASLRAGRLTTYGNEIYGRFGVVSGNFETDYVESGNSFSFDEWLSGIRFGGGMEVPVMRRIALRMDYTYTDYQDQNINYIRGTDNFANDENMLRLGIVYRMDDEYEKASRSEPADFGGFYVGAQGGYGSLMSEVQGPRQAGGGSTLTADTGDTGALGGVFAGYGRTFGKFYLGAEVDAELSDITWDQQRLPALPSRRVIAVDRDSSIGLSLRAGYTVNNGALLYVRGGPAWTTFDTNYNLGAQQVRSDETEQGWRFGGGLELPVREKLFVRMDYSYTSYDDYTVSYTGGTDTFDTEESQLRVGISYRF